MTCKLTLYACAAWLLLGSSTAGQPLKEEPPCAACLRVAVRAADFPSQEVAPGSRLALVVRGGDPMESVTAGAEVLLFEPLSDGAPAAEWLLDVRRALANLRGRFPSAQIGFLGSADLVGALLDEGLSAYVDVMAAWALDPATRDTWTRAHPGLAVWPVERLDRFADLLAASHEAAGRVMLLWPAAAHSALLADVAALAEVLPERLIPVTESAVACHPVGACRVQAFRRADTFETTVVVRRTAQDLAVVVAPGQDIDILAITPLAGRSARRGILPLAAPLAGESGDAHISWPEGVVALVLRLPSAQAGVAEEVRVRGVRDFTAAEIVARHQAIASRQARLVRNLITHARSTVTFEIPAFPAPVTVQADTTVFQGHEPTELVQENIRVNGVALASAGVPKLPIIEPERVAAPPLAITLTRAYQYTLAGREPIRGRDAYVIAFEPSAAAAQESLFRGRAWIDTRSFALLRVDAVQTRLRGPITSSQQIEEFDEVLVEGEPVWLLRRSEMRQVYQGAGLTTPIHRVFLVDRHETNPGDMPARREAAHAAPGIMLRETPEGLRYLEAPGRSAPARRRQVAGRATRVRTLAGGVIVDPNITRPLPFAGLNYTDFDLFGTGTQVNAFFGGAYGQLAVSAAALGGTRWQLRGDGFVMLARYNDRAFRDGRERYEENIRQRPARGSIGVVRPITDRTALHAAYALDYIALSSGETTGAGFTVPANLLAHGARLGIETQRAGWRIEGWWSAARRAGWRAWGRGAADYRPEHGSYQRFGVTAARPWVLTPQVLLRAEAAWMAGHDLDRFSRYVFGTFDNRLRGYPSASLRYDRGAVIRTAVAWQPPGRLRVDGFADFAAVRDPGFGEALRGYPGLGAALEAPGPFGLLFAGEWGFGVRGLNRDGSAGTHVIRLTAYKVF